MSRDLKKKKIETVEKLLLQGEPFFCVCIFLSMTQSSVGNESVCLFGKQCQQEKNKDMERLCAGRGRPDCSVQLFFPLAPTEADKRRRLRGRIC